MRTLMAKPVPDLNSIAKWIVAVHRMSALFMPGNFRRIGSPVIFSPLKFFQYRWIEIRRDTKIHVRPFDRARAPLGHLIDRVENDELSTVGYGECDLFFARHLLLFAQSEGVPIPSFALLQVRDFHSHVTDSAQRHDPALGFVADGIAPYGQFQSVAVGINNKERLFERRRRGIVERAMKFQFPFLRRANGAGKIFRRNFEAVYDSLQRSRGC